MRAVALLALTGLLAGCGILENFNDDINAVGRQIVADWKQRPDVAAAQFEYRHGLDLGERLSVEVLVHVGQITEKTVPELVDIARLNYWRGTSRAVSTDYAIYSTDDPPYADKPGEAKPLDSGPLTFAGVTDPSASWGPRPTEPSR